MLIRPIFKPHFRPELIEQDSVVLLLSDQGHFALEGKLHIRLASLLDGKHTVDDIVDACVGDLSAAQVYYALAMMEKKGYITEATAVPPEQAAFWSSLGADPAEAVSRLQQTTVSVLAFGAVDAAPLIAALSALGIAAGPAGTVGVVVTDDPLREDVAAYNREALAAGRPWLLIRPDGIRPWIGPLFRPGVTGCAACLAERYRGNRSAESFILANRPDAPPVRLPPLSLPSTTGMVCHLAVTELAKWLVQGNNPRLEGNLLTVDLATLELERHRLNRLTGCPACGRPQAAAAVKQVLLTSRKKSFTADGGHRFLSPEETLKRYSHLVSPITGVVSSLANGLPDNDLVHVYYSGHNFGAPRHGLAGLKKSLRSQSGGKGKTDVQAKAGALAEAVERYCGVFRGYESRIRASFRELGDKAIHPNACMNYSAAQYGDREAINARQQQFQYVPEPFDENAVIDWSPVWSLSRNEARYLPAEFCYYSHPDSKYAMGCSNGNAAGNVLEEAVLQGFFELVERDSVALWWYNRLSRPGVDVASFGDPYLQQLTAYYASINREFWVLDITADLNIPAFAAVTRRTDGPQEDIIYAFGAHLDPRIALSRAVTEMNQMLPFALNRPQALRQNNDQQKQIDDHSFLHWLDTATIAAHPYLAPAAGATARHAADYANRSTDDFLGDIHLCRSLAEQQGLEMLVLDQTRADIGMSVVKVIVPGLRHFWARLAPGRLYDVPVKLGWLERPYTEAELNPCPILL